jgi:long-chain acyl-CoA synthetase
VNLAENLERTARARGRSAALTVDDRVTTFAELDRDSRAVAGLLTSRGVLPRDRVGIVLPDVPEFAALYYGVLRVGAIVVALDPGLTELEVAA